MARIRTIKPEFFTSDDICALSPLARLLYVGLWCEADREGRLVWTPGVMKRRYLPDDACDIEILGAELIARGLIRLYGEGPAGRIWISKAHPPAERHGGSRKDAASSARGLPERETEAQWRARLARYRPGKFWLEGDWGPRPESGNARVPPNLLADWRRQ